MKDIKLVILDLDGTIIDAYPAITDSFNFTMRSLGCSRQSARVIRRAVGKGDKGLLEPFVPRDGLERAVRVYRAHHREALLRSSRLFPRAEELLVYLKHKGYKLAVASNRPTRFSLILLRHLRIKKYFDYILCADRLKQGKPSPEIIRRILRHFSLSRKHALLIGDMVIDAQAGRRAGVKTVMLTTGSSSRQELRKEKPEKIISRLSELFKIL